MPRFKFEKFLIRLSSIKNYLPESSWKALDLLLFQSHMEDCAEMWQMLANHSKFSNYWLAIAEIVQLQHLKICSLQKEISWKRLWCKTFVVSRQVMRPLFMSYHSRHCIRCNCCVSKSSWVCKRSEKKWCNYESIYFLINL